MEAFPKITGDQVALIRTELNTGHVLDEDFHLATGDGQKVYTVFDHFYSALNEAKEIVKRRPDIDCVIYDSDNKFLQFVNRLDRH